MELQKTISDLLALSTVVLMVAMIAYPMSVIIAQTAGSHLQRLQSKLVRRRMRRVLARLTGLNGLGTVQPIRRSMPAPLATRQNVVRRRAQRRLRTCLMGSLHTGAVTTADNLCDVVDMSAGGARVRLVDPMPSPSRVILGLRHFGYFPARVVWRNSEEMGLKFDLDPEVVVGQMRGLLPKVATAGAY